MQITAFQVTNFRSIKDSGWVDLENLTVLVGKNESGKTSLLKALHKFKPFQPDPYSLDREWPKGDRKKRDLKAVVCRIRGQLNKDEIAELVAQQVDLPLDAPFVIAKNYEGKVFVELDANVFVPRPSATAIALACAPLRVEVPDTDQGLRRSLEAAISDLITRANNGQLPNTADAGAWARERMARVLVMADNEPQTAIRTEFATKFVAAAMALKALPPVTKILSDYLISKIPTFIYMDDYKSFQGTARLNEVQQRRKEGHTTPEDKTLLTIMALSGLDLDNEVTKGGSADTVVKEQRQYDMNDAGLTLTNEISERWSQRRYEVQFRADAYSFFTMVKDQSGEHLIPLEDRSKGFQWFFSFDLLFMYESKGDFKGCVLLLDEPGLHLHPDAQRDLLNRLEAYAKGNTLVYSTHLPFMIDLRKPERIRTISETKDKGTIVDKDLNLSQPEAKFTLQAALGMTASQSHLIAQRNVVVEGADDFWIVSELSDLMIRSGMTALPDDVIVTAAGGASEAAYEGREIAEVAAPAQALSIRRRCQ